MVISAEVLKIRKELARDLQKLENILWLEFPNGNFSSISSAVTELNDKNFISQIYNTESDPNRWGYDAADILFRYKIPPKKSKPYPIAPMELTLSVSVRGNTLNIDSIEDPLEELKFDIVLRGTHNNNRLITTYHLDRHIVEDGDNASHEPHPHYHFQFGGKKMIEEYGLDIETGNIMFLNTPRIPHYPMELVLGIDFLISNFFPDNWNNLTNSNIEYNNLVEKYQNRFMKSYILNFASHWDNRVLNGEISSMAPLKINPLLK